MIREEVIYDDVLNGKEIVKEETVRFIFTLPAIKLYEQKTGVRFFEDYGNAWSTFMKIVGDVDISNPDKMSVNDQLKIMPILCNPLIHEFMIKVIPCLYAEIKNDKYVQNDVTANNAETSLWFMSLVKISFFVKIFNEISTNQSKGPFKKK
jgi:hypothetical protein